MERSDIKNLRPYRPVGSGSAGVRRRLMAEFQSTLERRLGEQREAWQREDSQLRLAMGAGAGVDLGQMISALGLGSHRMEDLEAFAHGGRMSARYDTALTTDENRAHWSMADALAVDAANSPMVRYTLRNRARYEVANNGYARGVGRSIANDFCGTGPRLHVDDDRLSESEQEDLENKFNSWADLIDLPGKLRTMRKARRQDGEAFACLITNPNLDHPVKLDLKLIETDQVRFVDIALLTVPSVDGIRYDDYGNPVSYHILRVHPGFWSYATGYIGMPWEYDVWQARYVIHWFEEDRPSQHRGLPELLPALPLYAILRRYTLATATAAETAADFSVLLETQAGAIPAETAADLTAFSTAALRRNLMVALPDGYTAKQMAAEHPNTTFPMFRKEILGEIGRAESVPYPIISGSAQDSNMASGQLDHKIYFGDREIERGDADRKILNRVLREWIAEAALLEPARGQAPYLPQVLRKIGPALSHAWHWPSNELGDVMKLAAAKKTNLSDGLTDIPAEFARKGRSWLKSFRANARALGITFEEYQHLVRDSIFSAKQTLAPDDEAGGQSGVPKPNQGALQEALK